MLCQALENFLMIGSCTLADCDGPNSIVASAYYHVLGMCLMLMSQNEVKKEGNKWCATDMVASVMILAVAILFYAPTVFHIMLCQGLSFFLHDT